MFKPVNSYVLVEPIYSEPPDQSDVLEGFRSPTPKVAPKYTVCKVIAIQDGLFQPPFEMSYSSTITIGESAGYVKPGTVVVVETHLLDQIALAEDELTIVPSSAIIGYFEDEN
tara:strand:+ start:9548 stop:9886 length:339 start_codon:yes stop_codon:yes gene_type:complete